MARWEGQEKRAAVVYLGNYAELSLKGMRDTIKISWHSLSRSDFEPGIVHILSASSNSNTKSGSNFQT